MVHSYHLKHRFMRLTCVCASAYMRAVLPFALYFVHKSFSKIRFVHDNNTLYAIAWEIRLIERVQTHLNQLIDTESLR